MVPVTDVKEEEVNTLSCLSVHVGGWTVTLDSEYFKYFHLFI